MNVAYLIDTRILSEMFDLYTSLLPMAHCMTHHPNEGRGPKNRGDSPYCYGAGFSFTQNDVFFNLSMLVFKI